jgi:hypothetical protein
MTGNSFYCIVYRNTKNKLEKIIRNLLSFKLFNSKDSKLFSKAPEIHPT